MGTRIGRRERRVGLLLGVLLEGLLEAEERGLGSWSAQFMHSAPPLVLDVGRLLLLLSARSVESELVGRCRRRGDGGLVEMAESCASPKSKEPIVLGSSALVEKIAAAEDALGRSEKLESVELGGWQE